MYTPSSLFKKQESLLLLQKSQWVFCKNLQEDIVLKHSEAVNYVFSFSSQDCAYKQSNSIIVIIETSVKTVKPKSITIESKMIKLFYSMVEGQTKGFINR